ncbi:hypothetical protein [Seohaeicola zhoushanensis]|uniref:Lipoprotein n=1 Tax=Seohaeicola zhoushanensis TaxID=1569283 RepID=A0A8J3GX01_9RHOB|nr:hypothetical protein [Seohaeicola zhoushanensis]GHF46015.1 hypothetical protein GCM10017056_17090 [Seohaeicola zhoushanensis]
MRCVITLAMVGSLTLSACAQAPGQVEASYVSPSTYAGRNCNQLMEERNEIVSRVNSLTAQQQKSADNDALATGVALILFWPAAFALAATKDNATALSAAKGNYDAVTTRMRTMGCKLPPEPAPGTTPTKA